MPSADPWTHAVARFLFLCGLIAQPFFVLTFWSLTWDDSAITMAFARTLALTGHIEGTLGSGIVEGYSTTLWMLVLAGAAHFTSGPAALLVAAKLLACALNLLNVVLVRSIIRAWNRPVLADFTAGVFGLTELTLYESVNAMEGPLMLTLLLIMVLLLSKANKRNSILFACLGCLFVMARLEAILLIAPLMLLVSPWRRRILTFGAWLATFAGVEVWRHRYFGEWVPNTIIAKRNVPYSSATRHLEMLRHLEPAATLEKLFLGLLVVLFMSLVIGRGRIRESLDQLWIKLRQGFRFERDVQIAIVLAAAGVLLDFGVGKNWGPPDRELFPTLPFITYLFLRFSFYLARNTTYLRYVSVLLLLIVAYTTQRTFRRMHNPLAPLYMRNITVDTIASLVPPVEEIRSATGYKTVTFATPDVGGVMLFGENLRVVDLGLLCDRTLARDGIHECAALYP